MDTLRTYWHLLRSGLPGVLLSIWRERVAQCLKWGCVQSVPSGTGPDTYWGRYGTHLEEDARRCLDGQGSRFGDPDAMRTTFAAILMEEVGEALQESDPQRLEEELVQVAAVCAKWVEQLHQDRARR